MDSKLHKLVLANKDTIINLQNNGVEFNVPFDRVFEVSEMGPMKKKGRRRSAAPWHHMAKNAKLLFRVKGLVSYDKETGKVLGDVSLIEYTGAVSRFEDHRKGYKLKTNKLHARLKNVFGYGYNCIAYMTNKA